jgi:hypothetical protein
VSWHLLHSLLNGDLKELRLRNREREEREREREEREERERERGERVGVSECQLEFVSK